MNGQGQKPTKFSKAQRFRTRIWRVWSGSAGLLGAGEPKPPDDPMRRTGSLASSLWSTVAL